MATTKKDNSDGRNDQLEDDWYETDHDRVFYAQKLAFERGEIEDAKRYAEQFDDWYIVITTGPYRSYDISYTIRPEHNAIHLDYYSVRPGIGYIDEMGDEIQKGIEELGEPDELDNSGDS